jgi:Predicted Fe-S protein
MNDLSLDTIWMRKELDSPCVKVCVIHPRAGICAGCFRTLDEIAEWSAMSPESRAEILAQLPDRATLLKKRRGGREGRLSEG